MTLSVSTSGTLPSTISRARPSTIAVLPTPASPTYSGLFLRRRHRISMVRSISIRRPTSGSMRPSAAALFRFVAYLSSALPPSGSRSPSGCGSSRPTFSSGLFASPCEMYWVTSRRVISCRFSRNTAWLCFSLKMATSTSATATSRRPPDCTWNTARCSTRWNPSVGCTSRSSSPGFMRGVVSSMCRRRSSASRRMSAPPALRISRTRGASRMESSRCSTVRNS